MLLAVLASAPACRDTCEQPRSPPEIHLLYGGLSVASQHMSSTTPPNTRHTAHLSEVSLNTTCSIYCSPSQPAAYSQPLDTAWDMLQNPCSEDTESEMKGVHRCRADSFAPSSVEREAGSSS